MRSLYTLSILLCLVSIVAAQESNCTLKLADLPDAPELYKFRMGMTKEQAKARLPQITFRADDAFGVTKTSINPDFDPHIDKASLEGVRTVSLDFLDGRLTSLWFGYDSTFKWATIPEFVTGISRSLHLPNAWEQWRVRGQQLKCADFRLLVTMVAEGPSFRIIDEAAEQTIAARRQAADDANAAHEAAVPAEVVADKRSKLYYPEGCLPVNQIKDTDRVIFISGEEAEKAGFRLAKVCP